MLYDLDGDELPSIAEYEAAASALTFFFTKTSSSWFGRSPKRRKRPFAFVDAYRAAQRPLAPGSDGDLDMVVGGDYGSILYYERGSLTAAGYVARQGLASPSTPAIFVGLSPSTSP